MRKKSWLIGATAMAAVAVFGALGMHSVKATGAESESAKEQIIFEQVGRESYSYCRSYNEKMILQTSDKKYFAKVDTDGTTTEIDNTSGVFDNVSIISSCYNDNYMYVLDGDNKEIKAKGTILNYDGSYAFGLNGYYDMVTFLTIDGEDMAAYIENQKLIVKKSDGSIFREIQLRDGYYGHTVVEIFGNKVIRVRLRKPDNNEIIRHDYYNIEDGSDITDKVVYDGHYPGYFKQNNDGYMMIEYNYDRSIRYFDEKFNLITDITDELESSFKINSSGNGSNSSIIGSVAYDTTPSYKTEGQIFYYLRNNRVNMQDDYIASYYGLLKGQKVYYATKNENNVVSNVICDENGNIILNNVASYYMCLTDKVITLSKDSQGQREYHILKAVLATETGVADINKDNDNNSVADVVAKDLDPIEIKDASGNSLTYDELDEDAKTVYNQKFNFNIKAANGVIEDGAALSVTKVLAGSDYEAAKEVTKDVANHIAVFNSDLLKDGAKIQPNGNIEFTVNVPTGFNSDLVAVYRLSSDGKSYTKLSSSVKDGKVVFTTDHFSTYMIVEEKQAVKPDDNTAADDNNNSNTSNNDNSNVTDDNTGNGEQAAASDANAADSTPGTGDVSNYIYYVIAIVCAAALGVVAMTAKNKKKAR